MIKSDDSDGTQAVLLMMSCPVTGLQDHPSTKELLRGLHGGGGGIHTLFCCRSHLLPFQTKIHLPSSSS